MKLREALNIAYGAFPNRKYRVSFERKERGMLVGDHFPERDELPFESQEVAWKMAESFADKMVGRVVNVHVVDAETWAPVDGYRERMLNENK